eukprot:Phypoly_transcript_03612.p1 GENE.Phypoly_transcript_03612~~Phypoly_transcript_03612.p1  ORF type:complete len:740 (+),score=127.61 Phypoly_transcript_03612:116-2335(+)
MSIEVEDSEFQRILLDSISESRASIDDAALARLLQLQEDALVQADSTPSHFGNAGTPSDPIVVRSDEDEELIKALEESLTLNSTNTSFPRGNGSEKNNLPPSLPPTTQPFLPLHQNISSTHPSSTPSTQFQTSTLPSPRTTTTTTSSASTSSPVDGLIPMLGSLRISPTNERAKNNKPIIAPTITSTTSQTLNNTSNTYSNNHDTISSGNSGDIGNITTTSTTEMSGITSTRTDVHNNKVRKILKPRTTKPKTTSNTKSRETTHSNSNSNPSSINASTLNPTPYPNPTSPTPPQNSQPPPRANSNNVNTSLPPSSLPPPRPYSYTTYHTSPTNASVNIAADLSSPFTPSSTSTNTNTNNVSFNTSTIPSTSINNINMYSNFSNNTQQRQQPLPSGRIPLSSTLFNPSSIPPTTPNNAAPSNPSPSPTTNNSNNNLNNNRSTNEQSSSRIPPTSRLLANPSSTLYINTSTPPTPTTPSTNQITPTTPSASNPPASTPIPPAQRSSYPSNPSLPRVFYQPQHRHPQHRLPASNQPNSSAGNAGNARRPAYVSYGGRVGSANDPTTADDPLAFEDDEALAQRLQLQEALQLQQEYDQMNSLGFHSHRSSRSNFHDDTVAQLLRYQRQRYNEGDSGSDYSDDEYEDEHDVDHMTYEQLLALEDRMGHVPRGASKSEIEVCPKFTLTNDHTLENKTCLVCHDEMVVGNEIRRLPCLHMYHAPCIDTWLSQKPTCPVCLHTIKNE